MTVEFAFEKDKAVDIACTDLELLGFSDYETRKLSLALINIATIDSDFMPLAEIFDKAADRRGVELKLHASPNELKTLMSNVVVDTSTRVFNDEDGVSGLKHGFYRALTLSQMIELIYASRFCDNLAVFIESEARTKKFKTRDIVLNDDERLTMFAMSGLVNKVGLITGDDYSDSFYRSLVKKQKPDVYFVNKKSGVGVIQEAGSRALSVGGVVRVLPEIGIMHTSDFRKLGIS